MIQTETTKAKILMVEVPNDAKDFHFAIQTTRLWYDTNESKNYSGKLPQGNWTILNTLDEVTDDEAEMIVSKYIDYYPLYIKEGMTFSLKTTAKKSIESLATSLGVQGKTIILYQLK